LRSGLRFPDIAAHPDIAALLAVSFSAHDHHKVVGLPGACPAILPSTGNACAIAVVAVRQSTRLSWLLFVSCHACRGCCASVVAIVMVAVRQLSVVTIVMFAVRQLSRLAAAASCSHFGLGFGAS
jgi:hypothetical protein